MCNKDLISFFLYSSQYTMIRPHICKGRLHLVGYPPLFHVLQRLLSTLHQQFFVGTKITLGCCQKFCCDATIFSNVTLNQFSCSKNLRQKFEYINKGNRSDGNLFIFFLSLSDSLLLYILHIFNRHAALLHLFSFISCRLTYFSFLNNNFLLIIKQ